MLSIDPWNILWTVVNLLVLYAIFKKFLYQPVMNVINARDDLVKSQFADAKKEQDDAKALKAAYQDKLESAKTEADQIILEARDRAQNQSRGRCHVRQGKERYCKRAGKGNKGS